jgi:hypothetical protein
MAKSVTDMNVALRVARGAKIERPEQTVNIPGLAEAMERFMALKREHSKMHSAAIDKKLGKLDELIAAVKGIKVEAADLGPVMNLLAQIQKDHSALMAKKDEYDEQDRKPCNYKVTGKRDRRGLIDLEAGLVFTPMTADD